MYMNALHFKFVNINLLTSPHLYYKGNMKKQHAIKVPQLYKIASNIYKKVKDEGASLKNLVYEANHPNKKAIYALVLTTLQKDVHIDLIFKKSDFLSKEPGIQVPLARVLITELLWGKKRLSSECRPVQTILAYEQIFQAHSSDIFDDKQDIKADKVPKPRFVRVNTLKITVNDAVDAFRDEGWILRRFFGTEYQEFLDEVHTLGDSEFMVDMHVKDLLIFPPKTQFYKHLAYKCSEIILQDKASCLPVTLLQPSPGSHVLDMCAAPGMKTTQLSALMQNKGKVYAVEKDAKRMETLKSMVESAGATCVETIFKDVLTVDSTTLPDVEYILVDPSCSGTGITDRLDFENVPTPQDRIKKLSGFQIMVLKHALRAFPKAKRIVYSTCSLLPEENEAVVNEVISNISQFKLLNCTEILPYWHNFGSEKYKVGKYCIYSQPEHDLTNGFFVAVFERLLDGEVNEFLIKDLKTTKTDKNAEYNEMHFNSKSQRIEPQINDSNLESHKNEKDVIIKKQKKKKKSHCFEDNNLPEDSITGQLSPMDDTVKTKKKKRKQGDEHFQKVEMDDMVTTKKKKRSKVNLEVCLEQSEEHEDKILKKKHKKSKKNDDQIIDETTDYAG